MTTTILDRETFHSTYGKATHSSGNTTDYARRRDASAVATAPEGYTQATLHLARAYDHAIGWALTYGLRVFTATESGVQMRGLGELTEAIRAHEAPLLAQQKAAQDQIDHDVALNALLAALNAKGATR